MEHWPKDFKMACALGLILSEFSCHMKNSELVYERHMVLQTGSDAILDHPTPAELPDDRSHTSDPSKSCRRTIQLNSAEIIDPDMWAHKMVII